jgi:hypothetical protein
MEQDAFVVCMGGSGNKMLEAIVHMGALGMWKMERLHILVVDMDQGNGNLQQSNMVVDYYNRTYQRLKGQNNFFSTEIIETKWIPPASQNTKIGELLQGQDRPEQIARLLYTESEINLSVELGFKGHPNLGVLFMQQCLSDGTSKSGLEEFIKEIKEKKPDRILLTGSCYGGTGAACIPALGVYLRKELGTDIELAALIFLPIFHLPKSEKSGDISIQSEKFNDKVKTVLSSYIHKKGPLEGLYNKIFLLGAPDRVYYPKYAEGHGSQKNPATFFEWFGCTAIQQFRKGELTPHTSGVWIAWQDSKALWEWGNFDIGSDGVFHNIELQAIRLLQTIGVYVCNILPKISEKDVEQPFQDYFTVGISENQRSVDDAFWQYAVRFVNWCFEIATHFPVRENVGEDVKKENEKFHGVKYTELEKMIRKLEKQSYSEQGETATKTMVYSLMGQRLWNAVVLCKLEEACLQNYRPNNRQETEQNEGDMLQFIKIVIDAANAQRGELYKKDLELCLDKMAGKASAGVDRGNERRKKFQPSEVMAYFRNVTSFPEENDDLNARYTRLWQDLFKAIDEMNRDHLKEGNGNVRRENG